MHLALSKLLSLARMKTANPLDKQFISLNTFLFINSQKFIEDLLYAGHQGDTHPVTKALSVSLRNSRYSGEQM